MRARRRVRIVLLVSGTCALARAEVRAADAPELSIACPSWAEADRTAFEARARAELTSVPRLGVVRVGLECSPDAAFVELRARSGARARRGLSSSAASAPDIEGLLALLNELEHELREPPAARDEVARTESPPAPASVRVAPTAGFHTELWQGTPRAALGAHGGVRLALPGGWATVLTVGADFGLGGGVSARELRGAAGVRRALLPQAELGAGAGLRALSAHPDRAQSSAEQQAASASLCFLLHYVLHTGSLRVDAGPSLELLLRPLVVRVDGVDTLTIPRWVGGLSIDASAD